MREIEQVKRQSKQLNSQPLCPFRVVQRDAGIAWVRACHKGGTRASLHMGGNDFGQIQVLAVDGAAAGRAGGMGLISGRKAFQRPTAEGVDLLNAIQDVYLDTSVTIA